MESSKEPKLRILSLGAGVQSSTMALMADAGEFGVKPDAAIFADTGWEPEPVIKHLEYLRTILSYPVYIVKKGNIQDDILTALAPGGNQFASAPFYTLNEKGKKGMGRRQCTREPSRFWWQKNVWPLIDKKMSREDCLKWYEGKGFKIPVKSACIGCPFHDDKFWIDMRDNRPKEFASAVEFDKKMRMHNPKVKNFVHRQCVPLDEVKFKDDQGPDLFNQECEGMCGL